MTFLIVLFGSASRQFQTKPSLGIVAGRLLMELLRGFSCRTTLRCCSASKCALFGSFKFTATIYRELSLKNLKFTIILGAENYLMQPTVDSTQSQPDSTVFVTSSAPPPAPELLHHWCQWWRWQSSTPKVLSDPQRSQTTSSNANHSRNISTLNCLRT